MASPIIEATSLHHVTKLAAHPPSNPHAPFPPPLSSGAPPLVLYIARVPGSRDVFLTPIKPRDKVVTAGDVQSSLYYLHINGPEDYDDPVDPVQHYRTSNFDLNSSSLPRMPPVMTGEKTPPPLPRRPAAHAPPVPPYPVNDGTMPAITERPPSPPPHQHFEARYGLVSRKPISPGDGDQRARDVHLPVLPERRPLPTPPQEDQSFDTLHAENLRLLHLSSLEDTHENPYTRSYATHPETLEQQNLNSRPEAGSLTLIRRDPGSGDQWNVAAIHDPPVEEVSSSSLLVPTATRRTKRGGAPLYLDITTPGYLQFGSETRRAGSRLSTQSGSSSTGSDGPEGVFRRRLFMPGSQFSEHGYGHRKHYSVSSASGRNDVDSDSLRRSLRSDRHQSTDIASLSSASPVMDRRSKGYAFASPWNGQCEFSTGATGRSLRCRHHLPGSATASEVSELRFNLPTKSRPPILTSKASSSHLFNRHQRQDSFDSDSIGGIVLTEEGRISLDLGRERAGGGFGGKQAKLGKLIIWSEGLKMLDLLVAANIGLWWRAWERASGGTAE